MNIIVGPDRPLLLAAAIFLEIEELELSLELSLLFSQNLCQCTLLSKLDSRL